MAFSVFILMRSSSGSESSNSGNSTNLCQLDQFTCGDSSCVPLEVIMSSYFLKRQRSPTPQSRYNATRKQTAATEVMRKKFV